METTSLKMRPLKKVLLIETQPLWCIGVSSLIHQLDPRARVFHARNVEEARNIYRAEAGAFDLIITDFNLDGQGSGLDLWKECRERRIPFVVMSGFQGGDTLENPPEEMLHAGHLVLMPKPLNPKLFFNVLGPLIDTERHELSSSLVWVAA